jgi:hypothetical protein
VHLAGFIIRKNTLSLCFYLDVEGEVTRPYKITGKTVVIKIGVIFPYGY